LHTDETAYYCCSVCEVKKNKIVKMNEIYQITVSRNTEYKTKYITENLLRGISCSNCRKPKTKQNSERGWRKDLTNLLKL
jgi:hypothetical protein